MSIWSTRTAGAAFSRKSPRPARFVFISSVMARIASELSSQVVLTSDNPRSEDPMSILNEMREGVQAGDQPRVFVNADRREAIRQAVGIAKPGDVVLIAGKGHETYQEINGVKHPFDDVAVLQETLELLHK